MSTMGRCGSAVAAWTIAFLILLPGVAGAQVQPQEGLDFFDTGPLRVREQFLLGMGFLAFEPESADVLDRGRWQVDVVESATNTWVHSGAVEDELQARTERQPLTLDELRTIGANNRGRGIYYADGEISRTSLAVRRGLGKGLQLTLTLPVLDFHGGLGDGLIEQFHAATGFDQAGRLGVPRDRYTVYIKEPGGKEVFRDRSPGIGLGDVVLGLKSRLPTPSAAWRLSGEALVKLPTGDEGSLYGSGAMDVGLQVLVTRYFDRSCIHASFGVLQLGAAEVYGLRRQRLVSGMVAYERAVARTASLIGQVTVLQSPFRQLDIQGLDEVAYLVDLGFKKGLSPRTVAFVAASENFLTFGSSADFGLHLGVTRTF